MELDDAVLAHACGEVGDSAACALWEGFLRCVRVLSCEHESRSNVCSDMYTCLVIGQPFTRLVRAVFLSYLTYLSYLIGI